MAKLIVSDAGMKYWALTKAEDYVIADAINSIERFVPKTDEKFSKLVDTYFQDGMMLADFALICLNDNRRRKGSPPIILMEGHSDSHTLLRGKEKAQIREAIRSQLLSLSDSDRAVVMEAKRLEISKQAGRDTVWDAIKATTRKLGSTEPPAPTRMAEQLRAAAAAPGGHMTILPAKGEKPRVLDAHAAVPEMVPSKNLVPVAAQAKQIIVAQPLPMTAPVEVEQRTQHRQVWVTKGTETKRIDRAELSKWTQDGWEHGRIISKVWITKGSQTQRVTLGVADKLLTEGWVVGRSETVKWMVKGSIRRLAKPDEFDALLEKGYAFGMKPDETPVSERPPALDEPAADAEFESFDHLSNKDLEAMAVAAEDDVDLDRVEAALAARRRKAQEPKGPTAAEFKTLQDQFAALQKDNTVLTLEFARLKRLVLEFAAA